MFDGKDYDNYRDAFESDPYRSRMKTLLWEQWGYCPTCKVRDGKQCLNALPTINHERIKRLRMRPHWTRLLIVFPDCPDCEGKGYFSRPLTECGRCGGIGQLQDEPSEKWWYEVWQEVGGQLWALNG